MEKRIFIGSFVKIPGFSRWYTLIKKEFGGLISGKWVPEENFHITYRFIGNVDQKQLEQIKQILKPNLNKIFDVRLKFKGVGAFPNTKKPRVFFIQVEDETGELHRINREINNSLYEIGFPRETRPFKPHITLKRIKSYKSEQFITAVERYRFTDFGEQNLIEVNIIESILNPKGAVYKKVE